MGKGTTSWRKARRHGYHFGLGWSGSGMEGAVRGGRRARRWTVPSGSWSSPGPAIDHTSEEGSYRPSFSSKGARWDERIGQEITLLVSAWCSRLRVCSRIRCRAKKLSRAESEVVEAVWRDGEDHSPAMSRRTVGSYCTLNLKPHSIKRLEAGGQVWDFQMGRLPLLLPLQGHVNHEGLPEVIFKWNRR